MDNPNDAKSTVTLAKVTRTINRPLSEVFRYIVSVSIPPIFPRYDEAPGVVSTSITSEWGTAGQQRVVTMDDGSTFQEKLLTVEQDRWFSYECQEFSGEPLKSVLARIEGGWDFIDNGSGTASLEWNYQLIPANEGVRAAVIQQLLPIYRTRMEMAVSVIKADLEGEKVS